jgi:hypothetical protein
MASARLNAGACSPGHLSVLTRHSRPRPSDPSQQRSTVRLHSGTLAHRRDQSPEP